MSNPDLCFLLFSVARPCARSGYLVGGVHYGRNGAPQNPLPRAGLYPCYSQSALYDAIFHLKCAWPDVLWGEKLNCLSNTPVLNLTRIPSTAFIFPFKNMLSLIEHEVRGFNQSHISATRSSLWIFKGVSECSCIQVMIWYPHMWVRHNYVAFTNNDNYFEKPPRSSLAELWC